MTTLEAEAEPACWVALPGYPGLFMSENGRILSTRAGGIRELKLAPNGQYREYRGMRKRDKRFLVHWKVCEWFHGPRPAGAFARHLDGNPLNNHYTNLAWGTPKENQIDSIRHGTKPRGEWHAHAKLTSEKVRAMRAQRAALGTPYRRLAKQFGVSQPTAERAVKGRTWNHA